MKRFLFSLLAFGLLISACGNSAQQVQAGQSELTVVFGVSHLIPMEAGWEFVPSKIRPAAILMTDAIPGRRYNRILPMATGTATFLFKASGGRTKELRVEVIPQSDPRAADVIDAQMDREEKAGLSPLPGPSPIGEKVIVSTDGNRPDTIFVTDPDLVQYNRAANSLEITAQKLGRGDLDVVDSGGNLHRLYIKTYRMN